MCVYEFIEMCNYADDSVFSIFNCADEKCVDPYRPTEDGRFDYCEVVSFDAWIEDGRIHYELNIDEDDIEYDIDEEDDDE